ncbi:MAG: GGDEF domain-containing protein [Solirubrobacterales bacterium]
MGTLFIVAGTLACFAALAPVSSGAPTTEPAAIGIVSIVAGAVMVLLKRPLSDAVIDVYAIGGILGLSYLIGIAKTEIGTAVAAMPYLWFSVYFGVYLQPRAARILIVFLCFSFGIALSVSEVATSIPLWVIFSATVVITSESLLTTSNALRVLAREDPLTGLLNRRGLQEAIGPVSGMSDRMGRPMTVVAIDLDDFKAINDLKGHAAGDRILSQLTAGWAGIKREADLMARIGGDEFVLVMPATSMEQGAVLVERLKEISEVSWSYGMVELDEDETILDALERADRDLYVAKRDRGGTAPVTVPESP